MPAAVVFACVVCCCIAEKNQNKLINRKTELSHHCPRSKAHSNEYENNTHKAEQSRPAGLGAGGSNRSTTPLLSSSDGARSCRNRQRCLLLYSSKKPKKRKQPNQVSPFYSKLNIFREGIASEKGECSPKSGSSPHILESSPYTKIK